MPRVVMYIKPTCWYCRAARRLLDKKEVHYDVVDLRAQPERRQEMLAKAPSHTVPQIFVDDRPLGGYDDIKALDEAGELDAILRP